MINTENCPTTIEYEYYLPVLPNGFEMVEHGSLSFTVYTKYKNNMSGQEIVLSQCTKKTYDPHFDNEHHVFEEIEINSHSGLCMDLSDNEHFGAIVVWDNDDYILEIDSNLSKNDLLDLAKSAKVLEN